MVTPLGRGAAHGDRPSRLRRSGGAARVLSLAHAPIVAPPSPAEDGFRSSTPRPAAAGGPPSKLGPRPATRRHGCLPRGRIGPTARSGTPFTLGVASGEPLPDGVVLGTRLASDPLNANRPGGMPDRTVSVRRRPAEDRGLVRVVQSGTAALRVEKNRLRRIDLWDSGVRWTSK
ncbi:PhoD-like phosphatase N-terminal domain-containing protein [Sphaerimonospora sp. CA-214678]|uniref:PhoD-like phosphatase N-terminal domain-containing protein n=1 Tax=Sphaerimonospora sp. CA-214678 TaxID=3240029 RepID=UPI003D900723